MDWRCPDLYCLEFLFRLEHRLSAINRFQIKNVSCITTADNPTVKALPPPHGTIIKCNARIDSFMGRIGTTGSFQLFNKFVCPFLCRIISGKNFKFSNSNATVFNTDLVRINSLLPLVPSVPWVLSVLPFLLTNELLLYTSLIASCDYCQDND